MPIYARQIAPPDGSAIEAKAEASILTVNKRPRLAPRLAALAITAILRIGCATF